MTEWVIDQLTGNMMHRSASPAHHVVKGDIDTLARETGQNSKDQRVAGDQPIEVRYTLIELSGQRKQSFLEAMAWKQLRKHLNAAASDPGETGLRLRRGIASLESDRPLRLLRIEDFGAKGLQGDDFDHDENFCLLCRAEFKTSRIPGRGGSYGLGKAVLWKFSEVATVLLSSLVKRNIGSVASRLAGVLEASGCREGWLQAELYRLREDTEFKVNWRTYPETRAKADLYGEYPHRGARRAPMIAEVKVIGDSYLHKNIDGHSNIDVYLPKQPRRRVWPTSAQIRDALGGSILADVRRLKSAAKEISNRYMILVRPYGTEHQPLGQVLRALKFSSIEKSWRFPDYQFDVRIWRL